MEQQHFTQQNNGVFHHHFGYWLDDPRDVQEERVRMLYAGAPEFKIKGQPSKRDWRRV